MAETSAYFESVTATRSVLLTEEEQLLGQTLLSAETEEFGEDDFYVYATEHFADWLKAIRCLSMEQETSARRCRELGAMIVSARVVILHWLLRTDDRKNW